MLSTQVLLDFYAQATRPNRTDALSHNQANRLVESCRRYPVHPVTVEVVMATLAARHRYQISIWDACIVESARTAAARRVLSEDLQEGMNFRAVRIETPFRGL